MQVSLDLDSSLAGIAEEEIRAAERAITGGVREVGAFVKSAWRGQVVSAGLGNRLANTIRQNNYPAQGESIGAASLVYAKPNYKKTASAAQVIDAFDRGVLITRKNIDGDHGVYLAIPIAEVGRMRGPGNKRITPLGWEAKTGRKLRFVYRRGAPSLLVDDGTELTRLHSDPMDFRRSKRRRRARKTVPIFLLVPQARLKKRLDLNTAVRAGNARLAAAVLSRWK